jgi:hypothetical protein
MRLRHFKFTGTRSHDGLERDLPARSGPDLIVAHGRYRAGKTTFLDTLACAKESLRPYGSPDARWSSLAKGGGAKVELDWEPSAAERDRLAISEPILSSEALLGRNGQGDDLSVPLAGLLGQPGDAETGAIHYLHDSRDLGGPLSFGADAALVQGRLTTRNSKFAVLYDVLDQPGYAAARSLASARLGELAPGLEIEGLRRQGTSFRVALRDAHSGGERALESLSASESQALLVALYFSRAPVVDSIVLVDAPELGFGDEGAVELVRALLRWTERTQLIVATASSAVREMPEVAHVVELGA